ncbi:MAG: hypothetical protein ABIH66_11455 [bacterium]
MELFYTNIPSCRAANFFVTIDAVLRLFRRQSAALPAAFSAKTPAGRVLLRRALNTSRFIKTPFFEKKVFSVFPQKTFSVGCAAGCAAAGSGAAGM